MDTFDPKHIYSDAAKLARLKDKKLFLFDIDGTIAVGDTLYEGSADLFRYIQAIGGRAYYITNNSTKSGLDYVKKFPRCISPGQHGGSVHHLRLYDAAFFEGELCRQENLRSGNRFLCGGTAKEWPLGNRGLRGQH